MRELMLGVDIGTTSSKTVAFTVDGRVVASCGIEYPLHSPAPGVAEQDPEQIHQAVLDSIRHTVARAQASPEEITLVSFSAAMHSLIAIDAEDKPLTASITWADNRAAPWAERIAREFDGHGIYLRTGTPIHPMAPLSKILWLRHDEPALFARAARFVGIKEFVFHRLFGRWLVDYSIASATGLFNLRQLDWDDGALRLLGITAARLSEPVPTTFRIDGLAPGVAAALGLAPDTPFIVGANDGVLSNLGLNAIQPGTIAVTMGSSGAMRTVVGEPTLDPAGRTFCYVLTDKHWVVGGPVNNGGIILRWLRDELTSAETETARRLGIDPYEVLTRIAERIPAGSEGLLFHPYLAGERAPLWNADLRGSFFGLAMHHRREHMIRAVLEGVMFALGSLLPITEQLTGPTRHIMATGGFARSLLWRQIMADVFDRDVIIPDSAESSCLGAAVLGRYALGRIASLDAVADMVGALHRISPVADNVAAYAQLRPIFAAIPAKLTAEYRAIADFQRACAQRAGGIDR